MSIKNIYKQAYERLKKKGAFAQFLILLSFFTTFIIIRTITHLQKAHILGNQNGSFHLHHMVPGIILLLISGFIGISFWHKESVRRITAVLFGIGAALTIDEFALWLFLKDVYWAKQGRDSVDAIIIVTIIILISLVLTELNFSKFLKSKFKK